MPTSKGRGKGRGGREAEGKERREGRGGEEGKGRDDLHPTLFLGPAVVYNAPNSLSFIHSKNVTTSGCYNHNAVKNRI